LHVAVVGARPGVVDIEILDRDTWHAAATGLECHTLFSGMAALEIIEGQELGCGPDRIDAVLVLALLI
jgi:hypothetical protein